MHYPTLWVRFTPHAKYTLTRFEPIEAVCVTVGAASQISFVLAKAVYFSIQDDTHVQVQVQLKLHFGEKNNFSS